MITRENYIHQILLFKDLPLVKVISGVRRSGKSSILAQIKNHLLSEGVSVNQIIFINFESFTFSEINDAKKLYDYITNQIIAANKYYIIIDEIQEVSEWEKCVNALMVDYPVDIYISGSNSNMLSSELATYLAGRYVEIPVYTLSFKEFLAFSDIYKIKPNGNHYQSFTNYLRQGGFPIVHTSNYEIETIYKIILDIYASIILRDTIQRYKIRDVELLERVIKFIFNNIGSTFSGKNVADFFKSQYRKVDINTIYNYLHALEGAFIVYRVSRYDIKGKEFLKTQEKFFLGDVSLLYAIMGYKDSLISGLLENIVFLELKRRSYQVYIGKLDNKEVDFIAEKGGHKIYVQVAYKLESPETVHREFSVLMAIEDHFPKYVVTMDEFWQDAMEGVKHLHIADFLLDESI